MSYEPLVHETQIAILRHLLFSPSAGFAQLQKDTNLTSDHFNFHIKKLLERGYVAKADDQYTLTPQGKEYANRLDTDENEIERQPKISVALVVERIHDGKREFLCQQRLKQPYYGFWGRLGGKVRWGESFEAAAERELMEETSLQATFTYKLTFHKRDYAKETGELLEDKVFVVMHASEPTGELMIDFEGGHNEWLTQEEFLAKDKIFESARDFVHLVDENIPYFSGTYHYDNTEY